MPSINLDVDYYDHPKISRLIGLLGRGAAELPVRLWCHCAKYHKRDGFLAGYSTQEIEAVIKWWGSEGKAAEALVSVGLLDPVEGGFKVHDWTEHARHLAIYEDRARAASKARWARRGSGADPPDQECLKECSRHPSSNATALRCAALSSDPEKEAKEEPAQEPETPRAIPGVEAPNGVASAGYAAPEVRAAAKRLVDAYQQATGTAYDPRGAQNAAILLLMSKAATEEQLTGAVARFGAYARKTFRDPTKRLAARNFFGGEAPAWPEWLDGTPIADAALPKESAAERVARQRAHLARVASADPTKIPKVM